MKHKLLKTILLCFPMALASCGNSAKTLEQVKEAGVLEVGTNAEFAPFEYIEGGNFKGVDMDLITEYAKSIGVTAHINDMDFDSALLSVTKNKVDVAIAAITKNEKREKTMSFSKPYYSSNQVVIVKETSDYASLTTVDAVLAKLTQNQAKIGCQRGTTGQYYIEGDADWEFDGIASTECKTYDTGSLAVLDLVNSKLDAVIIDSAPADLYCQKNNGVKVIPNVILTEEEYAIAVNKGNNSLLDSINSFIDTIKSNGTFDTIVSTYFGD
ncbi:MAG: transporter substrate-binding domain-containing protein [Bacilli bacterium]|nr:transporter substrate-binding domain-containing protein [Bacilli bacterium]